MIRMTTPEGYEVEVDLRFGFKVYCRDGMPYQLCHIENARVISGPPTPPGPGLPLRRPA